jgi:cytochrome bd ubiquinol oxidase subunit II
MHTLLDYEVLRLIWWLFLGVLLTGFAIMDGFDMGVATLLPFVSKSDTERRVAINTIGPVWDGNQVWFILGGGAIFAAFPPIYAAAFSGFYLAMFLVLLALILRPVGFEYRNKVQDPRWRAAWDVGLFIGGFVPTLVIGVAFGNLLQGVPFRFDADLRLTYEGGLFGLLNPFALLAGLVSVAMVTTHGAVWLALKTEGPVRDRALKAVGYTAPALIVLFALAGLWVAFGIDGYVAANLDPNGPSNPLLKDVTRVPGAWLANYGAHPWMILAPVLGLVMPLATLYLVRAGREVLAFVTSGLTIAGVIGTAGLSMFPFLMPSKLDPKASLTTFDATSSHYTLFVMLIATLIFLPIVLAYTSWVFRVLRGKVTADYVERNSTSLY